jgi:hypothetical protein
MIVVWFFAVTGGFVGWFAGLLPAIAPFAVNVAFGDLFTGFTDVANNLGAWLPWGTVHVCLPIVVGLYTSSFVIRIVKSLIPTVSG